MHLEQIAPGVAIPGGECRAFPARRFVYNPISRPAPLESTPMLRSLLLLVLPCVVLAGDLPPGLVRTEFVFEEADFKECHASTVVETPSGLVVAMFGGTREGGKDVGIWLSRHREGKWGVPVGVADGIDGAARHPCWNPVLFRPKAGPLMLFYKVGPSPARWWGVLKTSDDDGKTWSEARRLPEGILGPIKNKPVELADGTILCPSSTETPDKADRWTLHFERSADGGETWTKSAPVAGDKVDAIQPSILTRKDGTLAAMGRTRSGRIFETTSGDAGKTWSALKLTTLLNPNSGTDAVTLADGRHLLIYNHTRLGRSPLNLAVSDDLKTWKGAMVLESNPGEYSYPAIIQTGDGLVHAVWTWRRMRIRHAVIDPKTLEAKAFGELGWPVAKE